MNYELAKKLKDAGFPQKGKGDEVTFMKLRSFEGMENCYIPSLSELIEACGESIDMITRERTAIENKTLGWRAYCHKGPSISKEGKSPEEAVARLWLALNAK